MSSEHIWSAGCLRVNALRIGKAQESYSSRSASSAGNSIPAKAFDRSAWTPCAQNQPGAQGKWERHQQFIIVKIKQSIFP